MHLTMRHILAIIDAVFKKYHLSPLEESEYYAIKDAVAAVTDSRVVATMLRMLDELNYDPEEEAIIAALDAAWFVRGIIPSCLITHGDQRS